MRKIKLKFTSIYESGRAGVFTLILSDAKTERHKLPITIGPFEARMIAVILDELTLERPCIYDVIVRLFKLSKIKIKYIMIYDVEENVFFCKILLIKKDEEFELEITPSDAINLALRTGAAIYTYKTILENAGITELESSIDGNFTADNNPAELDLEFAIKTHLSPFQDLNKEDLLNKLNEAISNEDYELAALIRDELKIRDS